MQSPQLPDPPVGRRVPAFCAVTGIGRTTLFTLPAELRPASVLIGKCRIITEDPREWLARIARAQGGEAA
jgi:hypothetical protein